MHAMPLLQSVSLPMFYSAFPSREELFATAAEIGFPAGEIWGRDKTFEDSLALAARYHLPIRGMLAHKVSTLLNLREHHADAEREICESIDIAAEHGIKNLICFSGNAVEGQSKSEALDAVVEGFSRVAPYAEERGITLLLELLNSRVNHRGYLANHTAWGVEVCRRVNSPHLRLLYDIYHMQVMEGDIIRTIRDNIEWIGHFHTAGNPGRNEIGDAQELNYPAIFTAIRETGYTGAIGHEFAPLGDPKQALREAFDIVNLTDKRC